MAGSAAPTGRELSVGLGERQKPPVGDARACQISTFGQRATDIRAAADRETSEAGEGREGGETLVAELTGAEVEVGQTRQAGLGSRGDMGECACVRVYARLCVCACVCVRKRERERVGKGGGWDESTNALEYADELAGARASGHAQDSYTALASAHIPASLRARQRCRPSEVRAVWSATRSSVSSVSLGHMSKFRAESCSNPLRKWGEESEKRGGGRAGGGQQCTAW